MDNGNHKIMEALARKVGRTVDTLYKARRGSASKELARLLEGVTGLPRLQFLYPAEYGDPWPRVLQMHIE